RPKAHSASEIERDMYAETAFDWRRIDKSAERRLSRAAEIVALRQHELGNEVLPVAFNSARDRLRPEPGAVDHPPAGDHSRLDTADRHAKTTAGYRLDARHRRHEGDCSPVVLDLALKREHVGMAVDDTGLGRPHRRSAEEVGLHRHRPGAGDQFEILDLVLEP